MSLINDALKKAQRQRADEHPAYTPPAPGSGMIARRHKTPSANATLLIAAGAVVLVVLSVVITVLLVNRPATPATHVALENTAAKAAASNAAAESTESVSLVPAPGTPSTAVTPTTSADPAAAAPALAAPVSSPPSTGVVDTPAAGTGGSDASQTPEPPQVKVEPAPAAKPDPRIYAFIDSIRVTGIRSSGGDSRVLMNERVYRVDDIVEHTLGVRLIKVETDRLTFSDATGATYLKYF